MVILLATGVVPPVVAGLLAAGAMILSNVVTLSAAYRSISWTTVILVGGMLPLSTAIEHTGTADLLVHGLTGLLGNAAPHVILLAICVITMVLGQVISNMVTALIVAPVALALAAELGISPIPLLMVVTVSAAASFLTPIATPANMMVMGAAGYRFGDYWKLGLPLLLLFLAVAVFLVPVIWPF
nr:SLC13 family permease [Specibacter cremeus]